MTKQQSGDNAELAETCAHGPAKGLHTPNTAGEAEIATLPPGGSAHVVPAVGSSVRYFGDYELLEEIARGGMGVVFKARQRSLNRIVALKVILAGQFAGKEDVQRFHTEAEAAANLDHPGIVPIYEIGEHNGMHYFSMALVVGGGLDSKVKNGPFPPKLAAEMTQKVALAIAFAHDRGVIHRDLKPGNILLDRDGEPKLTDFGLAKNLQGSSELTTTGQILGTPSYMSPEQAAGKINEIGPAADIYSLGAILYALITGQPPFQADTPLGTLQQLLDREPVPPRQFKSNVPADIEAICLKCLKKSPGGRYPSALALAEDLGRFLRHEPIVARKQRWPESEINWLRRHPIAVAIYFAIPYFLFPTPASSYFVHLLMISAMFFAFDAHRDDFNRSAGSVLLSVPRTRYRFWWFVSLTPCAILVILNLVRCGQLIAAGDDVHTLKQSYIEIAVLIGALGVIWRSFAKNMYLEVRQQGIVIGRLWPWEKINGFSFNDRGDVLSLRLWGYYGNRAFKISSKQRAALQEVLAKHVRESPNLAACSSSLTQI